METGKTAASKLVQCLQRQASFDELAPLITRETAMMPDAVHKTKPLFWALKLRTSANVILRLVDAFPEAVSETHGQEQWTALHYVGDLNLEVVSALLRREPCAAKLKDWQSRLPLHWAAERNVSVDIVKLLLHAYRDATQCEDAFGQLPLRIALENDASQDLIDLLSEADIAPAIQLKGFQPETGAERLPTSILFAGLGSEYVGMLQSVKDVPSVRNMLAETKEVLGTDLEELCMQGPASQLRHPVYAQIAMYVAGLAAFETLKRTNNRLARCAAMVAGFGVGEFAALCVAGVISFADGLLLVKCRAEAMQEVAESAPQVVLEVVGLNAKQLADACRLAMEAAGAEELCQISTQLARKRFIVGGSINAVEECKRLICSAKVWPPAAYSDVDVQGHAHTALMRPARKKFQSLVKETTSRMKSPSGFKVYMCLDAQPLPEMSHPHVIASMLSKQITDEVRWKDVVDAMIKAGATSFCECGARPQLKPLLKDINKDAWNATTNVGV